MNPGVVYTPQGFTAPLTQRIRPLAVIPSGVETSQGINAASVSHFASHFTSTTGANHKNKRAPKDKYFCTFCVMLKRS